MAGASLLRTQLEGAEDLEAALPHPFSAARQVDDEDLGQVVGDPTRGVEGVDVELDPRQVALVMLEETGAVDLDEERHRRHTVLARKRHRQSGQRQVAPRVTAEHPGSDIRPEPAQGSRLDGLEVLTAIKRAHPDLPVVIISGHGNIETAVTAIKRGAYDYIEKPFSADRLILV